MAAAMAVALFAAVPAHAASEVEMVKLIHNLNARLDQLEKRNVELEREIRAERIAAKAPAGLESRVQSLEKSQAAVTKGLESEDISQYEPELTSRLKAVEVDVLDMRKPAKTVEALEGLKVAANLTSVIQTPSGLPVGTADGNSQLNYRADVTAELPLEPIGNTDQKLFAHFRMGQGLGLNSPFSHLGAFANTPNAVAFRASGANPDDSVAILGEAWYQATIPLPFGGFKPRSRQSLEFTFGKMDLFGFFDQNAVANDETHQFLNSSFVHNPLLDAGGQVGVDANGFQPGFVLSYLNEWRKPESWRLSLGVFGTHAGANYQRFFSAPLIMVQAETSLRLLRGLPGNLRFYAWRQGQGSELDGSAAEQNGWGISADQRVGDGMTLFGRYGRMVNGKVRFDRALTLGAEINGSYWNRGADAIGIAGAWLGASGNYRAFGGSGDLDGDGLADFRFTPGDAERLAEIHYRYRISRQFELSPNFQYVWKMGANPKAGGVSVLGLRAQLSY
ncbi:MULTISPECIES: carbohydrate porin [Rhodanobacter]|uniref:carbohydrate porin n=1 Tax=Rhodanobacter TaxID=75309 RepID=UPI000421ED41|nr:MULTISPECIES: carbohydrate porin [Rhodanobacter]UJJ54669.1 carbohydrate porin [Rhodanobacter thiooxydans]